MGQFGACALWGASFELSDFHLLRADGSTVLATISSHEVAWLEMGEFEFHELISKVPNSFRTLLLSDKKQAGEVIPLGVLAGSEIGGQLRESDLRALMGRVPGDVQANLVAYLRACEVVVPVMGPTADVISGAFTIANGADLLSDGNYVWRRDAADYVERYGVEVPMEAIVRWQAENWRVASLRVDEIDDISNFIWSGGL